MKKAIFLIFIMVSVFLIPDYVFAVDQKRCVYYARNDWADKKNPVVITFYYDRDSSTGYTGSIEWNPSEDHFNTFCKSHSWASERGHDTIVGCDGAQETADHLINGFGAVQWGEDSYIANRNVYVADETVKSEIFQDIYGSRSEDKPRCPETILEFYESNINFAGQGVSYLNYAFDDLSGESFKNDIAWLFTSHVKFTGYDKTHHTLYWEEKEPSTVNDNTCLTYDYFMKVLQDVKGESCENNELFSKKYNKINQLCTSYRSSALEYTASNENASNSSNSNVIMAKACMTACSALRDDVAIICGSSDHTISCNSLGSKIINWLYKIIRFVRYGVPIMLIILSVMDFIRAMAEDSEDEMKKATARFGKRLIAAALVFLVPFVLDFILGMFDLPNLSDPFCTG